MFLRFALATALLVLIGACSSDPAEQAATEDDATEGGASLYRLGNRFGWGGNDAFVDDVAPVFAKRCAGCHGCTNSPCQLKLTSYDGIARGSNPHNIFSASLFSTEPTRLKDAKTADEWKKKGFYSVIDGGENSLMYRMLQTGRAFNEPGFELDDAFSIAKDDMSDRSFECVENSDKLELRLAAKPRAAMPLGLSRMPEEEFRVLADWLKNGGKGPTAEAQKKLDTPVNEAIVTKWESFFNQTGPKERLTMRYLFEHLAFAKIYFDESKGDLFEIVRSRTAAPAAVDEIVTPNVNADPKAPFSYRLKKYTALVVEKDTIAWKLDDTTMRRWKELFLDADWGSTPIPVVSFDEMNPFIYFDRIPSTSRYQFMLDNAELLTAGMVKADVCNGAAATYAIRDRFWVWFLKPSADPSAIDPKLGTGSYDHLDPQKGNPIRERAYAQAFEGAVRKLHPNGFAIDDIWDGNGGKSQSAWLTILRHDKSASVHYGPVGGLPETMWVMSYTNFERLFYLLVVNYQTWASSPQKLEWWGYMSHVRSDAEDMFLSFMPEPIRAPLRDKWIQGFGRIAQFMFPLQAEGRPSQVQVSAAEPLRDFAEQLRKRLGPTIAGPVDAMNPMPGAPVAAAPQAVRTRADFERGLATVTNVKSELAKNVPNLVVLSVGDEGWVYSLIANRGYKFHNEVLLSSLARDPSQDTMTAGRGILGSYPELFMKISLEDAPKFIEELANVRSRADWVRLKEKREIVRNTPEFWKFVDSLHRYRLRENVMEAGLLDVSEYQFPEKFGPLN